MSERVLTSTQVQYEHQCVWGCVCVCALGGLLKPSQTGFPPSCRLWGWGGGIGGALRKSGEINGRSEGDERDVFLQTWRGNLLKSSLVRGEGRGINTAALLSGWAATPAHRRKNSSAPSRNMISSLLTFFPPSDFLLFSLLSSSSLCCSLDHYKYNF